MKKVIRRRNRMLQEERPDVSQLIQQGTGHKIIDTCVYMYRRGQDGEIESHKFGHPNEIPEGEGWTDSPATMPDVPTCGQQANHQAPAQTETVQVQPRPSFQGDETTFVKDDDTAGPRDEAEPDEKAIRARAKALKIRNWHNMGLERLLEEITEAETDNG